MISINYESQDLIDKCLKNYGQRFMTWYRRQWSRPSPGKRNVKRQNGLFEEALQIAEKRREAKGKGEKERYTHLNAEFKRIARRGKKAFLSDQCKGIEENKHVHDWATELSWWKPKSNEWSEGSGVNWRRLVSTIWMKWSLKREIWLCSSALDKNETSFGSLKSVLFYMAVFAHWLYNDLCHHDHFSQSDSMSTKEISDKSVQLVRTRGRYRGYC